jgi:hypothetical protein
MPPVRRDETQQQHRPTSEQQYIYRYHTFPGVRARRTKLKHSSHVYVQLWFETESKNDKRENERGVLRVRACNIETRYRSQ